MFHIQTTTHTIDRSNNSLTKATTTNTSNKNDENTNDENNDDENNNTNENTTNAVSNNKEDAATDEDKKMEINSHGTNIFDDNILGDTSSHHKNHVALMNKHPFNNVELMNIHPFNNNHPLLKQSQPTTITTNNDTTSPKKKKKKKEKKSSNKKDMMMNTTTTTNTVRNNNNNNNNTITNTTPLKAGTIYRLPSISDFAPPPVKEIIIYIPNGDSTLDTRTMSSAGMGTNNTGMNDEDDDNNNNNNNNHGDDISNLDMSDFQRNGSSKGHASCNNNSSTNNGSSNRRRPRYVKNGNQDDDNDEEESPSFNQLSVQQRKQQQQQQRKQSGFISATSYSTKQNNNRTITGYLRRSNNNNNNKNNKKNNDGIFNVDMSSVDVDVSIKYDEEDPYTITGITTPRSKWQCRCSKEFSLVGILFFITLLVLMVGATVLPELLVPSNRNGNRNDNNDNDDANSNNDIGITSTQNNSDSTGTGMNIMNTDTTNNNENDGTTQKIAGEGTLLDDDDPQFTNNLDSTWWPSPAPSTAATYPTTSPWPSDIDNQNTDDYYIEMEPTFQAFEPFEPFEPQEGDAFKPLPVAVSTRTPSNSPTIPPIPPALQEQNGIEGEGGGLVISEDLNDFLNNYAKEEFYVVEVWEYHDSAQNSNSNSNSNSNNNNNNNATKKKLLAKEAFDEYREYWKTAILSVVNAQIVMGFQLQHSKWDEGMVIRYESGESYRLKLRLEELNQQNNIKNFKHQLKNKDKALRDHQIFATTLNMIDVPTELIRPPLANLPFPPTENDPTFLLYHELTFLDVPHYKTGSLPPTERNDTGRASMAMNDALTSPLKAGMGIRAAAWLDVHVPIRTSLLMEDDNNNNNNNNNNIKRTIPNQIRIEIVPSFRGYGQVIIQPEWRIASLYREAALTPNPISITALPLSTTNLYYYEANKN